MNPSLTAFPVPKDNQTIGLTTREYFAAAALTGIMAAGKANIDGIAPLAVQVADALLRELKRTDPLQNPPFTNSPAS